jgi:hypothetical protein
MKNLNAEQVIQGLRENDSPYKSDQDNIMNAISLIKSQEQRITELTEGNAEVKANWQKLKESQELACDKCRAEFKRLTKENERLRNRITATIILTDKDAEKIKNECLERIELDIKSIQADTVRKMHSEIKERCIKGGIYPAFVARTID